MKRILQVVLIVLAAPVTQPLVASQPPGIEYDSDDISYLVAPQGVRNRLLDHEPEGAMTGRVKHTLRDFNGDGITDLGVFELKGGNLKKMHFSYEVHYGRRGPGSEIHYSPDIDARIDCDGIPFDIQLADFDDDGQLDISFLVIDPGFAKAIGMLFTSIFTDSINLKLNFYRLTADGYPKEPTTVRKVRTISMGKSGEAAAVFPAISFEDFNNDGHTDLLVQTTPNQQAFFPGNVEKDLFSRKAEAYIPIHPRE